MCKIIVLYMYVLVHVHCTCLVLLIIPGTLFARNKALGGGRRTAKMTRRIRTKRPLVKTPSDDSAKFLEQITEVWEWDSLLIRLIT
jgi:hypothetical protein